MKGFRTTFVGMFEHQNLDAPDISSIELPLIQRDYAQGRLDEHATEVREMFVDALHSAVTGGPSIGLDFVYGEANDDGKFEPLDGQQRLTTLFLLHWYLASRAGRLDADQAWTKFSYAIRPSARRFCEQLVTSPLPTDLDRAPSTWITDQGWYLHMWRFDPTVGAMLVMIDAIAQRFVDTDAQTAWSALVDEVEPAVWFQLLPVSDMGSADELYIKMNSRGKPLTRFEAFKAYLGQVIEHTDRSEEFGSRVDGPWTNLLWPYRDDDDIVDDEFMRYFDFLLEICEWREGRVRTDGQTRLERRAEALLGPKNPRRTEHLQFIFDAFDRLADSDLDGLFDSLFSTTPLPSQVRLFGAAADPNLFLACCRRYGEMRGTTRAFSLTDTQLLYAVLVHLIDGTEDVVHRLRVLRNVNEASEFELRVQNMPAFVLQVADFMRTGDLSILATYNQNQIADEQRKQDFLAQHPEQGPVVANLEDHPILRGTLASFTLDEQFDARASMFEDVFTPATWSTLTGALIATGEYQRDQPKSDWHQFGSPTTESVWRSLLVDRGDRDNLSRTGAVVECLLDELSNGPGTVQERMEAVIADFVVRRENHGRLDWRYYLAKYPWMREGRSGIYYGADQVLGYEMTMLRRGVQRSYYRDPYLYAMWRLADSPPEVEDPWFYGYSSTPRWMQLPRSGSSIRSIQEGIAVTFSEGHGHAAAGVMESGDWTDRGDDGWLLKIPQKPVDGRLVDSQDRVKVGASLLTQMIAAGL